MTTHCACDGPLSPAALRPEHSGEDVTSERGAEIGDEIPGLFASDQRVEQRSSELAQLIIAGIAWNVCAPTIDRDVPVGDELAGLCARGCKAQSRQHVVKPKFKQADEFIAKRSRPTRRPGERPTKLLLPQAEVALCALLGSELFPIFRPRPATASMLAGWIGAARQRTLTRSPTLALELKIDTLTPLYLRHRSTRMTHDRKVLPVTGR